jgi:hypothetical protein
MAVFTEAEAAGLQIIFGRQAEKVAARYEGVDPDDLAQEIWVWALSEGAERIRGYLEAGHEGRLTQAAYYEAVAWCESEKKRLLAAQGYNWRDDYTYTRPEVARLLPLALDPATVPGLSGGQLHDGPAAKTDPAHGGGMLASLIDIRTAFAKLSDGDQAFVLTVVGLDARWADIAATTGIKAESAYAKWMRILDRMVTRHLGRKTDDD